MKAGMKVMLIDGMGNLFEGEIADDNPKRCTIRITKVTSGYEKRNYNLHLAVSPLKNADRYEWFVEKSVEIGVDEITPLICHNTEKQSIKPARINNIIVSAMKQSLKAYGTRLNDPADFNDFISTVHQGNKLIAHCNPAFERISIADGCSKNEDVVILIGPEGDFAAEEIRLATERGFRGVHLGKSRLRTETAGIAACHSIYFINQ
jgi:16S rRNA (uracil1498-N3)-methyltransferase